MSAPKEARLCGSARYHITNNKALSESEFYDLNLNLEDLES